MVVPVCCIGGMLQQHITAYRNMLLQSSSVPSKRKVRGKAVFDDGTIAQSAQTKTAVQTSFHSGIISLDMQLEPSLKPAFWMEADQPARLASRALHGQGKRRSDTKKMQWPAVSWRAVYNLDQSQTCTRKNILGCLILIPSGIPLSSREYRARIHSIINHNTRATFNCCGAESRSFPSCFLSGWKHSSSSPQVTNCAE